MVNNSKDKIQGIYMLLLSSHPPYVLMPELTTVTSQTEMQLDSLMEELRRGNLPDEQDIDQLFKSAKEVFTNEPNIVTVSLPVSVCGDIHGQFPDLLQLFAIAGHIPYTNYLFLGDYVDRGYHSVETLIMLVTLKLRYPLRITIIRGNHESAAITQVYGFYDECLNKFGSPSVWKMSTELFDTLPLAAIIANDIFCVHGGLSPMIRTLDEIRRLDRWGEVPHSGPLCDLMWSDPTDLNGWLPSTRGAGFLFGPDVHEIFITANALDYVSRAHQLVMEGFKWQFKNKLVTVWSAPNYCYRCGNLASVMELDEYKTSNFLVFDAAPMSRRFAHCMPKPSEYFL